MVQYTDSEGKYYFDATPGDYRLYVGGYNDPSNPLIMPRDYYMYSWENLSLTESTIMDIPLPVFRVSVLVQDPAGNPVPDVGITTNQPYCDDIMLGCLSTYGFAFRQALGTSSLLS